MNQDTIQSTMDELSRLLHYQTWSEQSDLSQQTDQTTRITGGLNLLLYGVPGCGKSYAIQKMIAGSNYSERIVFHPDYTYADFVGQILPKIQKDPDSNTEKLQYVFVPGPFTRILKKAADHPESMCYLVIEEINRGNAPSIFGEIFQLIDRLDDGTGEYSISNDEIAKWVYQDPEHEVRIPSNLSLLATMNTSDQNIFPLDTAFQRRWTPKLIPNPIWSAPHSRTIIEGTQICWGAFATVINEEILHAQKTTLSSEDKRFGAYFIRACELSKEQFPEKALKYLWDDAFKMDREFIFEASFESLEQIICTYQQSHSDCLQSVLKPEIYEKMLQKSVDAANMP